MRPKNTQFWSTITAEENSHLSPHHYRSTLCLPQGVVLIVKLWQCFYSPSVVFLVKSLFSCVHQNDCTIFGTRPSQVITPQLQFNQSGSSSIIFATGRWSGAMRKFIAVTRFRALKRYKKATFTANVKSYHGTKLSLWLLRTVVYIYTKINSSCQVHSWKLFPTVRTYLPIFLFWEIVNTNLAIIVCRKLDYKSLYCLYTF